MVREIRELEQRVMRAEKRACAWGWGTLAALAATAVLALGRPVLMAISNKDFVGALTGRPPRERLAGTLAAVAHGLEAGAHVLRVHDVAAAADFLRVRAALRGEFELSPGDGLTPDRYPE